MFTLVLSLRRRLGRTVALLLGIFSGRGKVTARTSTRDGATPETAHVYTNVHTGQRYVKSDELIRTKKAQRQMKQLRKKFGRRA